MRRWRDAISPEGTAVASRPMSKVAVAPGATTISAGTVIPRSARRDHAELELGGLGEHALRPCATPAASRASPGRRGSGSWRSRDRARASRYSGSGRVEGERRARRAPRSIRPVPTSKGPAGVAPSSRKSFFVLAVVINADWICPGVQSGWSARRSAPAPATCGLAIEVPSIAWKSSPSRPSTDERLRRRAGQNLDAGRGDVGLGDAEREPRAAAGAERRRRSRPSPLPALPPLNVAVTPVWVAR